MNAREQFLRVMDFDTSVPALKAEYGYWTTAVKRFIKEGLPVKEPLPEDLPDNGTISGAAELFPSSAVAVDKNLRAYFGLDPYPAKFPFDLSPLYREEVLEETAEMRVYKDTYGITKKIRKTGTATPLEISYPIKNRKDFEEYKERYSRDFSQRLPRDWKKVKKSLQDRTFPLRLGGFPYGFFGFPRHLIGTKDLYFVMYDDPGLIHDMNSFFLDFVMDYWDELLSDVKPDMVLIWEDMAGKTGSLISPGMFREFMTPYYRKIIDYFKQFRISNIFVDSDGYIEDLIPLWLETGINGLFPFEIQAGNDMLRIRSEYPDLKILGAVDKRVFMADRSEADIDRELAKTKKLLLDGGYVPHADHHVPDDSCFKNFSYYRTQLNNIIDDCVKGDT